jgi:uncharacterized protein (TIGR00251 family)
MLVQIKVKPNSKKPRIEEPTGGVMTVYLKSPPAEGKANEELIARLAERYGVPRSRVRIKSGHSSRTKLVEIG